MSNFIIKKTKYSDKLVNTYSLNNFCIPMKMKIFKKFVTIYLVVYIDKFYEKQVKVNNYLQ
jgi:hypothetical protein